MTKDERFLVELYRSFKSSSDEEGMINPHLIAKKLAYKELLVKDILKGLRQANFIKIYSAEEIVLTERGMEVARTLLQQ